MFCIVVGSLFIPVFTLQYNLQQFAVILCDISQLPLSRQKILLRFMKA